MFQIARELEKLQPPLLLRSTERYEGENEKHIFRMKRKLLPFLIADIAQQHNKIMKEHYFARHILNRYNASCVSSEVISYLQFVV